MEILVCGYKFIDARIPQLLNLIELPIPHLELVLSLWLLGKQGAKDQRENSIIK